MTFFKVWYTTNLQGCPWLVYSSWIHCWEAPAQQQEVLLVRLFFVLFCWEFLDYIDGSVAVTKICSSVFIIDMTINSFCEKYIHSLSSLLWLKKVVWIGHLHSTRIWQKYFLKGSRVRPGKAFSQLAWKCTWLECVT